MLRGPFLVPAPVMGQGLDLEVDRGWEGQKSRVGLRFLSTGHGGAETYSPSTVQELIIIIIVKL